MSSATAVEVQSIKYQQHLLSFQRRRLVHITTKQINCRLVQSCSFQIDLDHLLGAHSTNSHFDDFKCWFRNLLQHHQDKLSVVSNQSTLKRQKLFWCWQSHIKSANHYCLATRNPVLELCSAFSGSRKGSIRSNEETLFSKTRKKITDAIPK